MLANQQQPATCHWCDRDLLPFGHNGSRGASWDHIIPKSQGGRTTVLCCRACNGIKSNMLPAEWASYRENNPGWWVLYGTKRHFLEVPKMIDPIKQRDGVSRAKATCDFCETFEEVPCAYEGNSPNEGQIRQRLTNQGWSYVKNKLRCPACEEKRKVVPMKSFQELEAPMEVRQPTKAERREITMMLHEVYDTEQERYRQGDTDDSVAEVLGVMPGWVSEIREDLFGPDGGNDEIEALMAEMTEFRAEATALLSAATKANDAVVKSLEQAKDFQTRLAKIKKAVGPRNLAKAGVA